MCRRKGLIISALVLNQNTSEGSSLTAEEGDYLGPYVTNSKYGDDANR